MAEQERARRTRNRLVVAAAEVFDAIGYERATMARISAAAGVTKGALYFHFSTKDELARAVQARACEGSAEVLAGLDRPGAPALQVLIDVTHALARLVRDDMVVRAGVLLSRERGSADAALDCYAVWLRCVQALLLRAEAERALRPGVCRDAVTALVVSMICGTEFFARRDVLDTGLDPALSTDTDTDTRADANTDTARDRSDGAFEWLARIWGLVLPALVETGVGAALDASGRASGPSAG
ncbi:ScbR family autoregulator-binding transcription factor [Streptomyces spiramyceticus]|uniref:ScbR family autoregulator-binding transcription factor n=1 Tax=Streptomyces spiramyceticus TaxID=299717 RepID=UPI00237AEB9D|nr:ScbR family autoregulator-binding transcription factor [Streptomyces spiramyceticus]